MLFFSCWEQHFHDAFSQFNINFAKSHNLMLNNYCHLMKSMACGGVCCVFLMEQEESLVMWLQKTRSLTAKDIKHIHQIKSLIKFSFQPHGNMGNGYKQNYAKTSYYIYYFQLLLFFQNC